MEVDLIKRVNAQPIKIFVAIAGGGQTFIGDYLSVSGASSVFIGALVPYHQAVFDKFVGKHKILSYASEEAARALALASFNECIQSGAKRIQAMGLAGASSIVKDGERVGRQHRFHLACHTFDTTYTLNVVLGQGRSRQEEEHLCKSLLFDLLCRVTLDKPIVFPDNRLFNGEQKTFNQYGHAFAQAILAGEYDYATIGKETEEQRTNNIIAVYCGSWNPIHAAHHGIAELSEKVLGAKPYLELCLINTDKGEIDYADLELRLKGIGDKFPVILNAASTFIKKVAILRKYTQKPIVFIVGQDTWERIWMEKYAGPLDVVYNTFRANNVRFLVFGRNGQKISDIYPELRVFSHEAENFDMNLSSSSLRKAALEYSETEGIELLQANEMLQSMAREGKL